MVSGFLSCFELKSALAELRSAACSLEAVLLALLHTRVAGEEAGGLQGGAVLLVGQQQSAGHTVTDGACLLYTSDAADEL